MIRIVPLDFTGPVGAVIEPADTELHDKAIDFCRRELTEDVNLTQLSKVWVALEGETVVGLMGYVLVPDVPVMRATSEESLRLMADRYNAFLADNGALGKHTFIHVARGEKPECRCPGFGKVLAQWGAKLADRVMVKVR